MEESFLEDVANMLSSGEVPNLFTGDELQAIRASLEKPAKAAAKRLGREARCPSNRCPTSHRVLFWVPEGSSLLKKHRTVGTLIISSLGGCPQAQAPGGDRWGMGIAVLDTMGAVYRGDK